MVDSQNSMALFNDTTTDHSMLSVCTTRQCTVINCSNRMITHHIAMTFAGQLQHNYVTRHIAMTFAGQLQHNYVTRHMAMTFTGQLQHNYVTRHIAMTFTGQLQHNYVTHQLAQPLFTVYKCQLKLTATTICAQTLFR